MFEDLGFPSRHRSHRALKAALVYRIDTLIKKNGFTQKAAAAVLWCISQPDVSKMPKGQFRAFSLERLLKFLNALGQDVEITVKKLAGKARARQNVGCCVKAGAGGWAACRARRMRPFCSRWWCWPPCWFVHLQANACIVG